MVHKFNAPNHDWCFKGNQENNKNVTVLLLVYLLYLSYLNTHVFLSLTWLLWLLATKESESLLFFFFKK